jgi:hypothetical protein
MKPSCPVHKMTLAWDWIAVIRTLAVSRAILTLGAMLTLSMETRTAGRTNSITTPVRTASPGRLRTRMESPHVDEVDGAGEDAVVGQAVHRIPLRLQQSNDVGTGSPLLSVT